MQKKTVLYVEDDEDDISLFSQVFEEHTERLIFIVAFNGQDAIDYLTRHKDRLPCIMMVDINMPKMDGIALLKLVKADVDFKGIEFLLMSTSTNSYYREIASHHGVTYYQKPVNMQELADFVNNIVRHCEAH